MEIDMSICQRLLLSFLFFVVVLTSISPPILADSSTDYFGLDLLEWYQIELFIPQAGDRSEIYVQLLRDQKWLNMVGATPGGYIHLVMLELGIDADALVVSITDSPPIQDGKGNLVTGTFSSYGQVLKITFESGESFKCTYGHRFFSIDQSDWVPAGELSEGERILAKDGFVIIASIEPQPGVYEVFNLEVADEHTYCVSYEDVVSHNNNPCAVDLNDKFTKLWPEIESMFQRRLDLNAASRLNVDPADLTQITFLQVQNYIEKVGLDAVGDIDIVVRHRAVRVWKDRVRLLAKPGKHSITKKITDIGTDDIGSYLLDSVGSRAAYEKWLDQVDAKDLAKWAKTIKLNQRARGNIELRRKVVLNLYYYSEYTEPEIAKLLDIPIHTVDHDLEYSRQAIRRALDTPGIVPR